MAMLLGEDYYDEQRSLQDEFIIEEPMQWWIRNEERFPKVGSVAHIFFYTPLTSVPSKRVSFAAGNIVSKKRRSLLPENVDCLVFLKKT